MTIVGKGLFPFPVMQRKAVRSISVVSGGDTNRYWALLVGYGEKAPEYAHGGLVLDQHTPSDVITRLQEWCGFDSVRMPCNETHSWNWENKADGRLATFLRCVAITS